MVRWLLLGPISSIAFLFPLNLYATSTSVLQAKKIVAGRILYFGSVDKAWLNGNYGATLRLKFEGGKDFSLNHFRVAPFGFDHCTGKPFQVAGWEQEKGSSVLVTELSPSRCESSRFFGAWLNKIQKRKGKLILWVHAPKRIVSATLTWHTMSADVIPRIVNLGIVPNQLIIPTANVVAKFAADAAVSKFECHVDALPWEDCTSPYQAKKLTNGWHTIEVRAWSVGLKVGRAVGKTFYIQVPPPSVEITKVDPAQDPTYSTTKTITFKPALNWGKDAYVECRLDGADFKKCVSPVVFSKLTPATHVAEFRLVKSSPCYWPCYPFICRGNGKPTFTYGEVVQYEWTVNQDALTMEWTQVPNELTNGDNFAFEFSASRPAEKYTCIVDSGASLDCNSGYVVSGLGEGAHQIQVQAWDQGSIKTTLDYHWVVDRTAPVLEWSLINPSISPTNSTTMSGQYTMNEPSTMTCTLDGTAQDSCPNPFEFVGLGQGSHRVEVQAMDAAGNSSKISHDWTIDLTAPSLGLSLVLPMTSPTNNTAAQMTFTSNKQSTFYCSLNGQPEVVCTSPWSLDSLSDGEYRATVYAMDQVGNQSSTESVTWIVDTTPPDMPTVNRTPAANPVYSRSVTFELSTNEPATFFCQFNESDKAPCSSPYVVNNLLDGQHSLSVTAVDLAGNESPVYYDSWTVMATAHIIIEVVSTTGKDAHFEFTSDIPPSGFECQLDGQSWSSCSSPMDYTNLAEGGHIFSVRAFSGGEAGPAYELDWTVDTQAPIITLGEVTPPDSVTNSSSIQIAFSANESAVFNCSLDGGDYAGCSSPVSYQGLTSGSHSVKITAVDAQGNTSAPVEYKWNVDLTTPNVVITSVTPSYTPTASSQLIVAFDAGTGAVKSYCSLDGGAATVCTSPWTITGLTSGNHSLDIYSQNKFGTSGNHATYTWKVDITPLTISNVAVSQVTSNSAVISWTTNLPASSVVSFGQGSAFDQTQTGTDNVTSHSVTLTGLATNILYQAKAISVDKDGRSVASSAVSFRTLRTIIIH